MTQRIQDEYERSFNLSGEQEQNKQVELDHILFQIEQFRLSSLRASDVAQNQILDELKKYLKEQNV